MLRWLTRFFAGTIVEIQCVINQEYSVPCRKEGEEIYLPFSFLHDYFEVFGSLSASAKGVQQFDWSHSNAKINVPKGTYDPKGIFMYFENYNVEVRLFDCWNNTIKKIFFL